ncbi:MAG: molecular chaperone DnaJ, partial [Selenomonadaceae bacterium]|nr:molecular chaperone DnaJ [Selenomonadaceae bacterium]
RRQSSSGSARPGPERGSDLRYDLEITFEEAAFGKEAELEVPRHENCPDCNGTGAKKGSKPEECPDCKGRGQIETAQTTPFGRIVSRRTCNRCHGTGEIIKNPCNTCHGSGKQKIKRRIKVSIPKGVGDGSRVRIAGGGEAGSHGGENGDLYVYLRVAPHKLFTRRGNDVIIEMPISFVQAALGDTVKVPTIDGQVEMTIPEGIQNGKVLRIKEKGIPYLRGAGRGDEHVIIKVVTPQKLTEKQKSLLREFQNVTDENATPEQKSFMDKVKDMFK